MAGVAYSVHFLLFALQHYLHSSYQSHTMGISTTQSGREPSSELHSTPKEQQKELDIEHVLKQLTLEEKISLTAGNT